MIERTESRDRPQIQPVSENHVRVITVEQQQQIARELHRALMTHDPREQMLVNDWVLGFADCYYRTASGSLRRVLPNPKLLKKLLADQERKHAHGHSAAAGQPEAHIHRAE